MFNWLGRRHGPRRAAQALYRQIVAQSRLRDFYLVYSVPDRIEARFGLLVLHLYIVLEAMRPVANGADEVSRELVDVFFADMDTTMRELGVGDMAVPKRMRKLAAGVYDRLGAYRGAVDAGDLDALAGLIDRHILEGLDSKIGRRLAIYAVEAVTQSSSEPARRDLLAGRIAFPAPAVAAAKPEPEPGLAP